MKSDRKRVLVLEFLNLCGNAYEEIPQSAWDLFRHLSLKEIAKPLVLKWRKENKTIQQITIKSGLSQRQVKHIIYSST